MWNLGIKISRSKIETPLLKQLKGTQINHSKIIYNCIKVYKMYFIVPNVLPMQFIFILESITLIKRNDKDFDKESNKYMR